MEESPHILNVAICNEIIMSDINWKLAALGQLALLLEASAPKPGNVNRSARFSDTDYRHFLTSASMMSRGLYRCASQGIKIGRKQLTPDEAALGELIETCVLDSLNGLNQRNTILGSILLYVPLTVSIAASLVNKPYFSIEDVGKWIKSVIQNTTVDDTVGLYRAFIRSTPGGHNIKEDPEWSDAHRRYDFDNPNAIDNIIEDNLKLIDLFRMSSDVDEISQEYANNFQFILGEVYPFVAAITHSLEDLEEAIVRSFVWLLSKRPDGLIIKKAGRTRAEEIRSMAEMAMKNWSEICGPEELIVKLDEALRQEGNLLNPGTTADIISTAVFCRLVSLTYPES
jgi:triphosphoribosyl-dephospho-CoA synthase